jgi:PadR family transcriptional regulator AphA
MILLSDEPRLPPVSVYFSGRRWRLLQSEAVEVADMSTGEMPAEHAILGLLLLDDRGGHGYDLARHFSEGQPLGDVLRLEPGMLYHHLKKLARAGWVTSDLEPQGARPPRQVFHLTDTGREELMRWLREPVGHTREIRLEFLVKLYFARNLDPEFADQLVSDQLATCRRLHESLQAQRAALPSDEQGFAGQVLDLRILQTGAAIEWLEGVA